MKIESKVTFSERRFKPTSRIGLQKVIQSKWWDNQATLKHAKRMTSEAEQGLRRPFHIFMATNRDAPVQRVVESFIRTSAPSDILKTCTPEGRPLVRWTLILFGQEAEKTDINREQSFLTLHNSGVETKLIHQRKTSGDSSISSARKFVIDEIRGLPLDDDPIILWLDDDLSFEVMIHDSVGLKVNPTWSWLHEVWDFHDKFPDIHIGLGDVTGAPPLPASSTLRTNLTDLVAWKKGQLSRGDSFRWDELDYYYDLSAENRDPRPWQLPKSVDSMTQDDLLFQLLEDGFLGRPLVATNRSLSRPQSNRFVRGGNTIVFHRRWIDLVDHPSLPRRGDTLWVQIVAQLGGVVGHFPFPLHHLRGNTNERWNERKDSIRANWLRRLRADLLGASLQRWYSRELDYEDLNEILIQRANAHKQILIDCHALALELGTTMSRELLPFIDGGLEIIEDIEAGYPLASHLLEITTTKDIAVARLTEFEWRKQHGKN